MRKRRKGLFIAGTLSIWIVFGLVGFLFGYYVGPLRIGSEPQPSIEEPGNTERNEDPLPNILEDPAALDPNEDTPNQPTGSFQLAVGDDTKVVFRTHFTQCQTIRDEVLEPLEEMLGLNEKEFKEFSTTKLAGWQVVRFSVDEVILFQTKNQICPNHFVVSHQDGFIAIYQYDEAGVRFLVEKTEIPISILPKNDQDQLSRGILKKTRAEVDQLLEDYSS